MPRTKKAEAPAIAPAAGELTPEEMFALSKAPRGLDKLRPRLEVGDGQPVDFVVRIHGALNVAGASTATVTEKAAADKVLAAVLARISPRARKVLLAGVSDDFAGYRDGDDLPELADDVVDLADDLLNAASREVNKPKAGAVSGALAIELMKRFA